MISGIESPYKTLKVVSDPLFLSVGDFVGF